MTIKSKPHLLFVDDDPLFLESINTTFRKGYSVEACSSPFAALDLLKQGRRFAVIVSDMRMPGMNGVDFLSQAATMDKTSIRIMLTGHADLDTAIAAVNSGGISHFLTKPCPTPTLKEIIESCVLAHTEKTGPLIEKDMPHSLDQLVGESAAMSKLRSMLFRLGEVDATVLFTGESGTGKSLAAEVLHSVSSRRDKPFVRVNCPSLSAGVFEAELFGSVKGAYTGSVHDSVGRFIAADKGSILLDEIGDVPLEMQSKLLQVIERKDFERVGDHKTIQVDVRIMAATNSDLKQRVAEGRFRKDLFYRLNVMHLEIPPLRQRSEDIPLLAEFFLTGLAKRFGQGTLALSGNALDMFMRHAWPGNVRELKHALERGAMLCTDGVIHRADLPEDFFSGDADQTSDLGPDPNPETLLSVLRGTGWNKARAARELGVSRSTLYRKMKEAGIPTDESLT